MLALPGAVAAAPVKAVAKTAVKRDWVATVVATPEGGFRMGNPEARVKLIEYGSLTCPHCAQFHADSMAALKAKYIASGDVSFEFRNFVLNGPDSAASVLARCSAARGFFPMIAAFFDGQPTWTKPFTSISAADSTRLAAMPSEQQTAGLARIGKLDAFVVPRWMTQAQFDACLADKAGLDKLLELRKGAVETWKLRGTPSFIINGKVVEDALDWTALEPQLQAALK